MLRNSEVRVWLLVLLNPFPCYSFLLIQVVNELRREKNTKTLKNQKNKKQKNKRGYFKTQFLSHRSTTISWWGMFFPNQEKLYNLLNSEERSNQEFLFGARKPILFRHVRIVLPIIGLPGDYHFYICFFFYFIFILFLFFMFLFFFYLDFIFNHHKRSGRWFLPFCWRCSHCILSHTGRANISYHTRCV